MIVMVEVVAALKAPVVENEPMPDESKLKVNVDAPEKPMEPAETDAVEPVRTTSPSVFAL